MFVPKRKDIYAQPPARFEHGLLSSFRCSQSFKPRGKVYIFPLIIAIAKKDNSGHKGHIDQNTHAHTTIIARQLLSTCTLSYLAKKKTQIQISKRKRKTTLQVQENYTVESRFLEPPRETKICSRNREVREIEGKNVVFD